MDKASIATGECSTSPREASSLPVEFLGVAGKHWRWRVRVWLSGGRGRYEYYEVLTQRLPSGRVEAIGPRGKARRLLPGKACTCLMSPGCIHELAVAAHVAREGATNGDADLRA